MHPRDRVSRTAAVAISLTLLAGMTTSASAHEERFRTNTSINHDAGVFSGRVSSSAQACIANRRVRLYSESENRFVASTTTNDKGGWRIRHRGTGTFWANVKRKKFRDSTDHLHVCRAGRSSTVYANNMRCYGRYPTVAGTMNRDTLEGTPGDDVIQALAGDDIINARGGNDLICAGRDDDIIVAGGGRDRVRAGPGTDAVRGGRGHDIIRGGSARDVIFGGGGRDYLLGGQGHDAINGGGGSDQIRGAGGTDLVVFTASSAIRADLKRGFARGAGNDSLFSIESVQSGGGRDVLKGDGGDNLLIGRAGDDLIVGRGGDDVLMPLRGSDKVRGGAGEDILSYALGGRPGKFDLTDGDGSEDLRGVEGLEGTRGADRITGTTGDDVLLGNLNDDLFFPGPGDDYVHGGDGNEEVNIVDYRDVARPVVVDLEQGTARAEGVDELIAIRGVHGTTFDDVMSASPRVGGRLWGHEGNDRLSGNRREDSLFGGAGNDHLSGGDEDDWLKGEEGDDTLRGEGGQDKVEGGSGHDTMIGGIGGATFLPGPGDDVIEGPGTLDYREIPHGVHVDLAAGIATAEGSDIFTSIGSVRATGYDDTLLGTDGDDTLGGSSGNDHIEGRAGDDHLRGHDGDDTILGGEGRDDLYGDMGDDPLDGGPGVDHCFQGQPMRNCEYVSSEYVPAPAPTHTPSQSEQPDDAPLTSTQGSVALQVDPSHSGGMEGAGLIPPLRERWSVELGGADGRPISYPIVVDGRVFVTVPNEVGYGTMLHALDAVDGSILWTHQLYGTYYHGALAYGGGRLFAQNYDGTITAFDPASGEVFWKEHIPGQHSFPSAPVVHQGSIFTSGLGQGGTLYKIDAATGQVVWSREIASGHNVSPALSSERVFAARGCEQIIALLRDSGDASWERTEQCSTSGTPRTPVRYEDRLYVRTDVQGHAVDPKTGGRIGDTFLSSSIPAFGRGVGVFVYQGTAMARDARDGVELWSFAGDENLASNPLIVDGVAYLGSTSGNLYGVDVQSGALLWQVNLGAPIASDRYSVRNEVASGLGVGPGLLVVPAGTRVVAFESG